MRRASPRAGASARATRREEPRRARTGTSRRDAMSSKDAPSDARFDALTNLLDAESEDVVRELLDDGCRAWCDELREGNDARAERLVKNARKIKEKLRLESDEEAVACANACEALVRECVWRGSANEASGSGERWTTHERLNALLRERVARRADKWRIKASEAANASATTYVDFDWVVRAVASANAGSSASAATCRAALRVSTAGVARDISFDIHPGDVARIARIFRDARDACATFAPSSEPPDAPPTPADAADAGV